MDPQAPNTITPETPQIPKVEKGGNWVSILAIAIFIIFSLGIVVFLYYQNQQLKKMLVNYQTPIGSPKPLAQEATPNPEIPTISSPSADMKVTSPLKITGVVPAGWMFEGVFPIKLVDSSKKLIVQGQAKEKVAGSWQSGKPVDFTATLTFKAATGSGTLILSNDNPSGIPANSKTFELPIKF